MHGSPEDAFERYRHGGEAAALAEVFDRTAPEVLRVALHLTGRRADAEDLLQATYLTAMERAALFPAGGRLVPWLLAILLNRLRMQRRRERIGARAALPPGNEPEDPVAAAESSELREVLADRLATLPELYRAPLVLQLQHGLTAAEIAQALNRPRGTVRSQLSRGMELLRAALPAGLGAGAVTLLAPRASLASVRAAVLAGCSEAAGPVAAFSILGGLVVMKNVAVAAAAVLTLGLGWCVWNVMSPAAEVRDVARQQAGDAAGAGPETRRSGSIAAEAEPAARRERLAGGDSLVLRLRWSDGTAAAGIPAWLHPQGDKDGSLSQRWLTADREGVARSGSLPAGSWLVGCPHGGRIVVAVREAETTEAELTLPAGRDVRGIVVDPDGRRIAAARIAIGPVSDLLYQIGETGADGTFLLRGVDRKLLIAAFARGFAPLAWAMRELEGIDPLVLQLEDRTCALRGRVVSEQSEPIAGATVLCGPTGGAGGRPGGSERTRPQAPVPSPVSRTCQTDAKGEFEIEGVPLVDPLQLWVGARGFAIRLMEIARPSAEETFVEVKLDREAILIGTVRLPDRTPCPGQYVHLRDANSPPPLLSYRGPSWGQLAAESDAAGRFMFRSVPAGRIEASVTLRSREQTISPVAWVELEIKAGETRQWDAVLDAERAVVGTLVDHQGAPLAEWTLALYAPEGMPGLTAVTGADGGFRLAGCVDADYTLHCIEKAPGGNVLVLVRPRVRPGPEPLHLVVPQEKRATCVITGVVQDAHDQPLAGAQVFAADARARTAVAETTAGGQFRLGPMVPGTRQIEVQHGDHGLVCFGRRDVAPMQSLDLGILRLPEPALVTVHVLDEKQRPLTRGQVYLKSQSSNQTHFRATSLVWPGIAVDNGTSKAIAISPGRYTVSVYMVDSHHTVLPAVFEARAGETARLDLQITPGIRQLFRIDPEGLELPAAAAADFVDERGATVLSVSLYLWQKQVGDSPWVFLPGRYTARFSLFDGRTVELPFELTTQEAVQPITVRWGKQARPDQR